MLLNLVYNVLIVGKTLFEDTFSEGPILAASRVESCLCALAWALAGNMTEELSEFTLMRYDQHL